MSISDLSKEKEWMAESETPPENRRRFYVTTTWKQGAV